MAAALLAALVLAECGDATSARDPATWAPSSEMPSPPASAPSEPRPSGRGDPPASSPGADTPAGQEADASLLDAAPAENPSRLAGQIEAAERAIRSDGADEALVEQAGRVQQIAYRQLSRTQQWRAEVLALLPEDLRMIAGANVAAGEQLRSTVEPGDQLPDWRIVAPAPADELLAHYREAETAYGVGWEFLAAIHLVETRMGRIRGDSVAGAQGPMQFIPDTWAAYGEGDINDNRDAILAAARYLAAHGAPEDMPRALWHYNHSDAYVAAVSAYADQMRADPRAFNGYYHWQVFFMTAEGDVLLEVGFGQ